MLGHVMDGVPTTPTGLPKLMKCHICHGHFGQVTKSFGDHVPNIEIFHCLWHQSAEIFVHVMVNLGGWRNHVFVMVPGRLIEMVQYGI